MAQFYYGYNCIILETSHNTFEGASKRSSNLITISTNYASVIDVLMINGNLICEISTRRTYLAPVIKTIGFYKLTCHE